MDTPNPQPVDWSQTVGDDLLDTDIIIALGLENLSDEDKAVVLDRMIRIVQKAVAERIVDQLSPELQQQLETLMGSEDTDLESFLDQHVPQLGDIVKEEIIRLKQALLTKQNPYSTPQTS